MSSIHLYVPEELGLSSKNIAYIDDVMARAIHNNILKGGVTLVARHGKIVQCKAYGEAKEGEDMRLDHIFRWASMSKPIGAVALLQLFDQGKVMPSDALSDYIPFFEDVKVAVADASGDICLEEAKRPITIHDLLTMRAGIGAVRALGEEDPAGKYCAELYRQAGIIDTMHDLDKNLEEVVSQLEGMPLASHPGTRWYYSNLSSDILGRVVEIVSGKNLYEYLKENILDPLDMTETSFFPDKELWSRIPDVFEVGSMKALDKLDFWGTDSTQLPFGSEKKFYNIAAGLCGTIMDYYKFAQMLCDGGIYQGKRILSPNAIRLMTTNHIGKERSSMYGHAWGYMVNVQEDYNTMFNYMGLGSYGWHGYWGSVFNVWPEEDLVSIFIAQGSPVIPTWKPQEQFLNVVANSLLRL